jgi:hypothetical protein
MPYFAVGRASRKDRRIAVQQRGYRRGLPASGSKAKYKSSQILPFLSSRPTAFARFSVLTRMAAR